MSDSNESDEATLNVVQDAELLLESVREMHHLSTATTTTRAVHDMIGNLAKSGHILPEVFSMLATGLDPTLTLDGEPVSDAEQATARVEEARALMEAAGDHALGAAINLLQAQKALEAIR